MSTALKTMSIFTELDNQNETIKKQWLKYSLFYFIGYPFLMFAIIFFYDISLLPVDQDVSQSELLLLVLMTLRDLIFFGITYYFAYKKSGTKWLTWCLLTGAFRAVIEILAFLKASTSGWKAIALMLELMLYIGWYTLTLKLRKVNRQMQLCKQFPQDGKSCIDILEKSLSQEDLNSKFYNLLQANPQLEPILSPVYRIKKNMLNSINQLENGS